MWQTKLNSKFSVYNIVPIIKAGIYYHCQLLLLSICFGSTMVLFVLYCNVVNILDWVVSLTSSLENSFMMIHVEIC